MHKETFAHIRTLVGNTKLTIAPEKYLLNQHFFQLKQQKPHTYPLREVLRQQASPELVQALGCVGMRAS
jgi:hypothetical protein